MSTQIIQHIEVDAMHMAECPCCQLSVRAKIETNKCLTRHGGCCHIVSISSVAGVVTVGYVDGPENS